MTRKEEIEKGIEYFKKNIKRLVSLYKEMYGETICLTCPGSNIEYAYQKIFNDRDKVICKYKMKRGVAISTIMRTESDIPKGIYTFHNITDEIAEALIKYGYGSKFIL